MHRFSLQISSRLRAVASLSLLMVSSALAQTVPHFTPAYLYPTPGLSGYDTVADVNSDGYPDVITSEYQNFAVGILLGQPDGTPAAPVQVSIGSGSASLNTADFNEDGKADIVSTNGTSVLVLFSRGDGTFAPTAFVSTSISANYATPADFNGDGHMDLGVTGANGFAILLGNGAGGFTRSSVMATAFSTFYMLTGDFNHDGKMDFMGANLIYLGNGDGTFAPPLTTQNIPFGSQLADFNGDGYLDLVTLTAQQRQDGAAQSVNILLGRPDGSFIGYSSWTWVNQRIGTPVVGDFNADGRSDVAVPRGATGEVVLLAGTGFGTLVNLGVLPMAPGLGGTTMSVADLDRNGSSDLLLLHVSTLELFRNTHGNPPLLARLSLSPASIVGGRAQVTATLTLGGVAPAAGLPVALASSDTALANLPGGNSVTIPAGASEATFSINTSAVAQPSQVNLTATAGSVTQTSTLSLVAPYALVGISFAPAAQYSTQPAVATITLSGPADANAVVTLVNSNPAVAQIPASITVAPGQTSVSFPVTLRAVAVDTPVLVTASLDGVSTNATLTVLKPADAVQVSRAQFVTKSFQLRVEATGTNATATIAAYNATTQAFLGNLTNSGGGKFSGNFITPAITSITLKSSLGGSITAPVDQK